MTASAPSKTISPATPTTGRMSSASGSAPSEPDGRQHRTPDFLTLSMNCSIKPENWLRACYALLCDRIPEGRRPGDPLAQPEGLGKRHHNGAPRRGARYLLFPSSCLGTSEYRPLPNLPS